MMRKLLTSVAVGAIAGVSAFGVAKAVNLPLFSGAATSDPAAVQASLNALIQALNFGTSGLLGFVPGPIASNVTTVANTFTGASITVATGQITSAGQSLKARCSGQTANNTNSKSVALVLGNTPSQITVSSGTFSVAGANWDLELQWVANTSPVTANYGWVGRSFVGTATGPTIGVGVNVTPQVAIVVSRDTAYVNNNAAWAIPVLCQYSDQTAAASDLTLQTFSVEQVK